MNLIDFYVTEIISDPVLKYGKLFISVNAESYGIVSRHELMFNTKAECFDIYVGYKFLS